MLFGQLQQRHRTMVPVKARIKRPGNASLIKMLIVSIKKKNL